VLMKRRFDGWGNMMRVNANSDDRGFREMLN
jgi:hypothetical protein